MLEALMSPGQMTQDQWLIVGILVFVVIGILYFCYRTYKVIKESMNTKYKPNIGMARMDKEGKLRTRKGKPGED